MKKSYSILFLLLFISCHNSIKAKIEYRKGCSVQIYHEPFMDSTLQVDYPKTELEYNGTLWDYDNNSQSAYVVNTSIDKAYEFTIKIMETTNDTIDNYRIMKVKLSPGDEKFLGCSKSHNKTNTSKRLTEYSCTGQRLINNEKELK